MAELFKTLEFKSVEREQIGKYAHPVEVDKDVYCWGESAMPLLMTIDTTFVDLKKIYKGLDFDLVNLVLKKFIDIKT